MPKRKIKKTKIIRSLSPLATFSRRQALSLIAVLVLVGGYAVYRSFAGGLDVPTASDEIVLQYDLPHLHGFQPGEVQQFNPETAVALYGDGKLVCGGPNVNTATKYTQSQLTPAQITAAVSQISSAGFLHLKPTYNTKIDFPGHLRYALELNLIHGTKSVQYYRGPKPAAFAAAVKVATDLCTQAAQSYQPASLTVNAVKKPGKPAARAWTAAQSSLPTIIDGRGSKDLTGPAAQSVLSQLAGRPSATLGVSGTSYDIAIIPKLPPAKPLRYAKAKKTSNAKKSALNTLVPDAHAAGHIPIQVITYNGGTNSQALGGAYLSWWQQHVDGKGVAWNAGGVGGPDYSGGDHLAAYNALCSQYCQAGVSKVFLMTGGDCYGLGAPIGGGYDDYENINGGFAVVWGLGGQCPSGWTYAAPAHETGHTFGLQHIQDGNIMQSPMSDACANHWPCGLNGWQHDQLTARSGYFNTASAPPPPPQSTIQGYTVVEPGGVPINATVRYICCDSGRSDATNADPYYIRGLNQGYHRLQADAPLGYFLSGVTDQNQYRNIGGDNQYVVNTGGQTAYNLWWRFRAFGNLFGILKSGGSNTTEVHAMSGSSSYQNWIVHAASALGSTANDSNMIFKMGNFDNDGKPDLYVIRRNGGCGKTEVHVLSGASNYQGWVMHACSGLELSTNNDNYQFVVGDYDGDHKDDVYAIKRSGGCGNTEVHVLSAGSNFQSFALHACSGQPATTNDSNFVFAAGDYDHDDRSDLYIIRKNGGSNSTEVHVLSASSNFTGFSLHTGTALGQTTGDTRWYFGVDGFGNVYAINGSGGSGKVEVHVLGRSSNFSQFILHAASTQPASYGPNWIWDIAK